MIQIIPSILAKSYRQFEQLVRRYELYVDRVQLDIIDGEFAPETTITGHEELIRIGTRLAFDAHLMVKRPAEVLGEWYRSKADRIILHAEAEGDLARLLVHIKEHGKRAALSLSPETPAATIESLIPHCDFIQFMTVYPGAYGAGFLANTIKKITDFHAMHPHVTIAVDGGIIPETARQVIDAGASLLVCGSYLKNAPDVASALWELSQV
jgi:ribulose-phosphate 3-epimerase